MGYHAGEFGGGVPVSGAAAMPWATPSRARISRGAMANRGGALAEDAVARLLVRAGATVLARRWRGTAGEIDLVCRIGSCVVFVEVKSARHHAEAAGRLDRRQMDRICRTACEFCATLPSGQATEMRFDVALVDGMGRVELLENAFCEA